MRNGMVKLTVRWQELQGDTVVEVDCGWINRGLG